MGGGSLEGGYGFRHEEEPHRIKVSFEELVACVEGNKGESNIDKERGIPQKALFDMLIEAANPLCRWERKNKIQCILGDAVREMYQDEREEGVMSILDSLYTYTLRSRPNILPSLFPAFAMMCSSNKVDWSLIASESKTPLEK